MKPDLDKHMNSNLKRQVLLAEYLRKLNRNQQRRIQKFLRDFQKDFGRYPCQKHTREILSYLRELREEADRIPVLTA